MYKSKNHLTYNLFVVLVKVQAMKQYIRNQGIKKLVITLLSLKDKYSNNSIEDEFLTLFEQFI